MCGRISKYIVKKENTKQGSSEVREKSDGGTKDYSHGFQPWVKCENNPI